jgi:hypothetical protein
MSKFWLQIQKIFTCIKQPLEEISNPIIKEENFVSINNIKEPEPEVELQKIEEQHNNSVQYNFEENEIEKEEEVNYCNLPDLIIVDREEYDSYQYYASDDEEDDYYRH